MQRIFLNISIKVGALYVGKLLQIQLFQFRNISVHPPQSHQAPHPPSINFGMLSLMKCCGLNIIIFMKPKFNLLHKSKFQLNQIHKVVHTDKWFSLNKKHALFFNFLNHFTFKANYNSSRSLYSSHFILYYLTCESQKVENA